MTMSALPYFWSFPPAQKIGCDQITAITHVIPAALLGNAANAAIATISLAGGIPAAGLLVWCAGSCAIIAYLAWRYFSRTPQQARRVSYRTIRRAIMFSVLLALPWSVLIPVYLGSLERIPELVLFVLCAGMAASGSVYLAPVYPAALAYMGMILLPVAVRCFVSPGYGTVGWLTISYAGFLCAVIATSARLSIDRSSALRSLARRDEALTAQNTRFQTALNNMSQGLWPVKR